MKNPFSDFKIASLNVPFFFGMSIEIVEKEPLEMKREILKELYGMRLVLSSFYTKYNTDFELNEYMDKDEADIIEDLGTKYFNEVFDIYSKLEQEVFKSNYFVLLPKDKRLGTVLLFDKVRELDATMIVDENEGLSGTETNELIKNIFNFYNTIQETINQLNEFLD
ncbi:hypothetical protein [Clostridium folliculivorans]|uniref:hypothetical protein n=1 Tax=Clostridium folliculivorans TaxID=2886038 RepID=UPI0021C314C1|nr:hypothetical protein [Clostridium folliculivorans]GKU29339.1 hypothetical protein CFB3_14450 [Clostridium folliculivorans]